MNLQGFQPFGDSGANVAAAENKGRSPTDLLFRAQVLPAILPAVGPQPAAQGKEQPQCVFGNGLTESAGSGGQSDVFRKVGIAVCTGPGHLHPAKTFGSGKLLHGWLTDDDLRL